MTFGDRWQVFLAFHETGEPSLRSTSVGVGDIEQRDAVLKSESDGVNEADLRLLRRLDERAGVRGS